MPASYNRSSVNIDSEASLDIYLYLQSGGQALPDPSSPVAGHHDHLGKVAFGPGPQSTPGPIQSALTLEEVLKMSLGQLDRLQERVGQMETSMYGLLTRIYGCFPSDRQPFSLVFSSRMATSDIPTLGSPQHRQLVFSQYKKMLTIAKDPTRTVDIARPSSARGARALQDYQMQLMLIAAQRKRPVKRKQNEDDDTPRRPPPPLRTESEHFRAMQESCRVLDLSPGSPPVDHRSDRAIHNATALSDYQTQLLLLEQQNKKRLLLARQRQEEVANVEARISQGQSQNNRMSRAKEDESSLPIRTQRGSRKSSKTRQRT